MAVNHDDPQQSALLMTALESIRRERDSELLATHIAVEESMGRYSIERLKQAHHFFGLALDQHLTEEHIIGTFQARLRDAPRQEREMRQNLYMIGEHRNSHKIMDFARNGKFGNSEQKCATDMYRNLDLRRCSAVPGCYHWC